MDMVSGEDCKVSNRALGCSTRATWGVSSTTVCAHPYHLNSDVTAEASGNAVVGTFTALCCAVWFMKAATLPPSGAAWLQTSNLNQNGIFSFTLTP
ncbi:hypothetical protein AOLI_G00229490 [Acnodon oligacanthus]